MAPPVIAVDALVLRTQLSDVTLRPGLILSGRVTERHGAHGLLVLAGVPLVARLPDEVPEGEPLRFRVLDASGERLQLGLVPQPPPGAVPVPEPPRPHVLPLGDGRAASIAPGGGGSVVLRYESPALGRMDLRLDAASCAVHVAQGAADAVRAGADGLRGALSGVLGRPVQVTVHPRAESLDVRA